MTWQTKALMIPYFHYTIFSIWTGLGGDEKSERKQRRKWSGTTYGNAIVAETETLIHVGI